MKNVGRSQVERKRKALPCEGGIVGSIPIDQPNAEDVLMDWASPRDGRWFGYPELSLQELKETWWARDRWWRYVNK